MMVFGPTPRMEVALFVEDVVVRQQALGGDRDDAVVAEGHQGVGDMRRAQFPKAGRASSRPSLEGASAMSSSPSLTTVPTRTGGTLSNSAISMSATRDASMKPSSRAGPRADSPLTTVRASVPDRHRPRPPGCGSVRGFRRSVRNRPRRHSSEPWRVGSQART